MKVFKNVLTSASSGVFNWSDALDMRHAKNGYFNVEFYHGGTATEEVTLVWSGSSSVAGSFYRSGTSIITSGTSIMGPGRDGHFFTSFSPDIFPFMKLGAIALVGVTTTISATLIVD